MSRLREIVMQRYKEVMFLKPKRTANRRCKEFVEQKKPFKGSNMYGGWEFPRNEDASPMYVVYSWGTHFPMYLYEPTENEWFKNTDGTSHSSCQHRWDARLANTNYIPIDTETIKGIIEYGISHIYQQIITEEIY